MLITSSAKLRYLSIPQKKMRLVADSVKGMPVEKAMGILNYTPRIAAHHLAKTLKSAAANALSKEGTDNLRPDDLIVKNIIVDAAPTAKRIRFRSMGRVYHYRKRFCHLTVYLEGNTIDETVKKAAPKQAPKEETVEKEVKKIESKAKTETKRKAVKKTQTKAKADASDKKKSKSAPKKKVSKVAKKDKPKDK
jgi:large subunit ribosomal protein L22